jgi:predicted nuclease of predicted toxin-antitoxin system
MKLLIDQNISKRIIESISDTFSDSIHVNSIASTTSTDNELWDYALKNEFILVTTDSDFFNHCIISDQSPKIILVQGEVITSNKMEWALRINQEAIEQFIDEDPANCLTITI